MALSILLHPPTALWRREALAASRGTFWVRMDGASSLRIYIPAILRLRGLNRLPLHVPRIVGAAALELRDVVDHVAGTRARGLPGRGAWVATLECESGALAPLDVAVAVPSDADCGTSRGVAAEGTRAGRGMRESWKRRRTVRVRRASRVRRNVVAAPRRVPVDVNASRAMARPRR